MPISFKLMSDITIIGLRVCLMTINLMDMTFAAQFSFGIHSRNMRNSFQLLGASTYAQLPKTPAVVHEARESA